MLDQLASLNASRCLRLVAFRLWGRVLKTAESAIRRPVTAQRRLISDQLPRRHPRNDQIQPAHRVRPGACYRTLKHGLSGCLLVVSACSAVGTGSGVLRVDEQFSGDGSMAFVVNDKTVHCFPAKPGKKYRFTGILRNSADKPVDVAAGHTATMAVTFVPPGGAGVGASPPTRFIPAHGQITFYAVMNTTHVDPNATSARVTVNRLPLSFTYNGMRYHSVDLPYLVRADIPKPGTAACGG